MACEYIPSVIELALGTKYEHNHPTMKCDNERHRAENLTHLRIIVERLFYHIKMPILSRVIAHTGYIDPITVVGTNIMINLQKRYIQPFRVL